MICDFRDSYRFYDRPYVLIDGEGELITDRVQVIDLTTGRGLVVKEEITDPDNYQDEVAYVPPMTLVSGTGLVVAQGVVTPEIEWDVTNRPFVIIEGSP